ncbi:MAG TPA: hypothetical protein VGX49_04520 [Jatrophihabitans sp.]|nr:hypothetical protein [Jatrophihabitans sp.]
MTGNSRSGKSPTRWYVVSEDVTDRELAERACLAVLDVVRARTRRITVDAYSDYRDSLSARAQAPQDELRARGQLSTGRNRGDPGMGVELDPSRPADWDLVRAYAAWSIHVELDSAESTLATLHDCGHSIGAELTEAEADQLAHLLAGVLRVEPLEEWRKRDKADRRGRR